jgi:transcriptional regulator with XRE-family HTH domain
MIPEIPVINAQRSSVASNLRKINYPNLRQRAAYSSNVRERRGWSQAELATKISSSRQSAVARLEDPSCRRYSIATLLKIAGYPIRPALSLTVDAVTTQLKQHAALLEPDR